MPEIKVTFAFERVIDFVAYTFPEDVEIGAQYDVDAGPNGKLYAVIWSHPDDWRVIDNMPHTAMTLPFEKALATLVDKFGLHIPCVTP